MKITEIYSILDEISPFEFQDSWDNSGLLVGSMEDEFDKIYVGVDIDSNLLKSIESNSLLILHHPLIFSGLKRLNPSLFPSNIIYELIKRDIKLIAMHTNFDKTHLNRYVAKEVLGYEDIECQEYLCYFEVDKSFEEFAKEVSEKLNIKNLRVVKTNKRVSKVALCTGSGSSLLSEVKADCFLTGDIKYHTAIEAKENGISLIDINHFESEVYFGKVLQNELKNKGLNAIIASINNPFDYIKGK